MLSIAQLNGIAGATQMEVVLSGERMSDNSDAVSDPDCLGSIFGAEDLVYQSSDWTAVRDQVAREPRDDNEHWVEQTAVLYPTERARQGLRRRLHVVLAWLRRVLGGRRRRYDQFDLADRRRARRR